MPDPLTPVDLFRRCAARHPGRLAVASPAVTYAELDARSNQVAWALHRDGLSREEIVDLDLPGGLELYLAMLGVAKSGAAFGLGRRRGGITAAWLGSVHDQPATPPPIALAPNDLAYVIGTSGTTGPPKCVLVENRGLSNLALWAVDTFGIGPGSRVMQRYPPHRDAMLQEVFSALICGATLHPLPAPIALSPRRFVEWMRAQRITHADTFPSHWRQVAAHTDLDLPDLEVLILGGETFPASLLPARPAGCRMFNLYGPTEATVTATCFEVPVGFTGPAVPIGRPLWRMTALVLDQDSRPCPPGRVGELYLGGIGLSRGYLDDPARTAQAFPLTPAGKRLYRTGDLVLLRADGLGLEFAGRLGGFG